MVSSGEALGSATLDAEDRAALSAAVVGEGARLERLIDQAVGPLAAGGGRGRAAAGLGRPRRDPHRRAGRSRRGGRGRADHAAARPRPAAAARRRRPAGARVRQPVGERDRPRRRSSRVGARPCGGAAAGRARRRPRARRPASASRSGSSRRFIAATAPRRRRPGPASGWRSSAGSSRPTAAPCASSRCPARARRSFGPGGRVRSPLERPHERAAASWSATTSPRSCGR